MVWIGCQVCTVDEFLNIFFLCVYNFLIEWSKEAPTRSNFEQTVWLKQFVHVEGVLTFVSNLSVIDENLGCRRIAEASLVGGLNQWGPECKASAHAARHYVRDCRHRRVLLKIDMHNAFNSLRRDSFPSMARVRISGLCSLTAGLLLSN